jgi:hypothetical protein
LFDNDVFDHGVGGCFWKRAVALWLLPKVGNNESAKKFFVAAAATHAPARLPTRGEAFTGKPA